MDETEKREDVDFKLDSLKKFEKQWDEKILPFLSKHAPLIIILILVFAAIIRFKYMTVNGAVWWDEADYLTVVKHYALDTPHQAAPWRARGIALLWTPIYYLGGTENTIRFFIQIFSVVGVYLTYRVGKLFFNKKIGLLGAFMFAGFWLHIFWSARISLGLHGMVIWCLAAICFWKGYIQKKSQWYLAASAALIGVGIFIYEAIGFMLPGLLLFLVITEKHKFLLNKRFWMFLIVGFLAVLPFFAWNYSDFHERYDNNLLFSIYPRLGRTYEADFGGTERSNEDYKRSIGAILSDVFLLVHQMPLILKWPFLVALLFGLLWFLDMFLGFDLLWKNKSYKLKKDLFIFLWALIGLMMVGLLVALTGFVFEPRLWMPVYPMIFLIAAAGLIKMYDYIKKFNVTAAVAVVLAILIFGTHAQLTYADTIIQGKKDSFSPIKHAGLWLKENSEFSDSFIGCGQYVQFLYYSERKFWHLTRDETKNDEFMEMHNPKFFIIDGHDPWCSMEPGIIQQFQEKYPTRPVQAYFLDPETKKQPIIIIYEFVDKESPSEEKAS